MTSKQPKDQYIALLVADNMINRRLIGKLLQRMGLDVIDANHREAVQQALQNTIIDIAFVDDVLGRGNGNDIATDIHALQSSVPIIAMTTETKRQIPELELFAAVLTKPIQESELSAIMMEYLPFCMPEFHENLFNEDAFESFYLDTKLRKEIVELLLTDPLATTQSIEDAFETKHADIIYDKVHYLKASFNYLQSKRLVAIVQHMLHLCRANEMDALWYLKDEFLANYQVLRDTLQSYLRTKLSR